MHPKVYLETSVISYFANSLSSDVKIIAEQKITRFGYRKQIVICTPRELMELK